MQNHDSRAKMEAEFFDYVSESYHCFMSGDDARCEQIDAKKGSQIESKAVEVKREAEGLMVRIDDWRLAIGDWRLVIGDW